MRSPTRVLCNGGGTVLKQFELDGVEMALVNRLVVDLLRI